ncbi:MAG: transglutaminase family protein, partial [Bacteroidales bacterium]|nr:transglutaminase family protein [Bacteroidales bacterium]
AHLMIALCRAKGWYARYVNGFILGEGQTHAWVEVSDGNVWVPYDPTLDVIPDWGYVKIAHGRDANDCPTNRGRFLGFTTETMSVSVSLSEL